VIKTLLAASLPSPVRLWFELPHCETPDPASNAKLQCLATSSIGHLPCGFSIESVHRKYFPHRFDALRSRAPFGSWPVRFCCGRSGNADGHRCAFRFRPNMALSSTLRSRFSIHRHSLRRGDKSKCRFGVTLVNALLQQLSRSGHAFVSYASPGFFQRFGVSVNLRELGSGFGPDIFEALARGKGGAG